MEFSKRKISSKNLKKLVKVKVDQIQPFTLMSAPVYIYLKENKKLVSLKGPLDFFLPKEIEKLRLMGEVYLPEFVKTISLYVDTAKKIRELLEISPPLAPYDISIKVLELLGPLWWRDKKLGILIEPYLVTIFANTLCDPLPPEKLLEFRDKDVQAFEAGLFLSGWAIFLALHLGYTHLNCLHIIRETIIERCLKREIKNKFYFSSELEEIISLAHQSMRDTYAKQIQADFFRARIERAAQKITFKLNLIEEKFANNSRKRPSIYGERGFIDA